MVWRTEDAHRGADRRGACVIERGCFLKTAGGGRREDASGCIKQQVADAQWRLAGRFEAGLFLKRTCYVVVGEALSAQLLYQQTCTYVRHVFVFSKRLRDKLCRAIAAAAGLT